MRHEPKVDMLTPMRHEPKVVKGMGVTNELAQKLARRRSLNNETAEEFCATLPQWSRRRALRDIGVAPTISPAGTPAKENDATCSSTPANDILRHVLTAGVSRRIQELNEKIVATSPKEATSTTENVKQMGELKNETKGQGSVTDLLGELDALLHDEDTQEQKEATISNVVSAPVVEHHIPSMDAAKTVFEMVRCSDANADQVKEQDPEGEKEQTEKEQAEKYQAEKGQAEKEQTEKDQAEKMREVEAVQVEEVVEMDEAAKAAHPEEQQKEQAVEEEGVKGGAQAEKLPQDSGAKHFPDQPKGSWLCAACPNINWPLRIKCNRCQEPRAVPTDPAGAAAYAAAKVETKKRVAERARGFAKQTALQAANHACVVAVDAEEACKKMTLQKQKKGEKQGEGEKQEGGEKLQEGEKQQEQEGEKQQEGERKEGQKKKQGKKPRRKQLQSANSPRNRSSVKAGRTREQAVEKVHPVQKVPVQINDENSCPSGKKSEIKRSKTRGKHQKGPKDQKSVFTRKSEGTTFTISLAKGGKNANRCDGLIMQ
jgi:hypothetical protein